VGVPVRVLVI